MGDSALLEQVQSRLSKHEPLLLAPGALGERGCASVTLILRLRPISRANGSEGAFLRVEEPHVCFPPSLWL